MAGAAGGGTGVAVDGTTWVDTGARVAENAALGFTMNAVRVGPARSAVGTLGAAASVALACTAVAFLVPVPVASRVAALLGSLVAD